MLAPNALTTKISKMIPCYFSYYQIQADKYFALSVAYGRMRDIVDVLFGRLLSRIDNLIILMRVKFFMEMQPYSGDLKIHQSLSTT